jgi:hypothetical protein
MGTLPSLEVSIFRIMPWPKLAFRAEAAPLAGSRGIAVAFGIWIPWPRRFPDPVPSIAILFMVLTGLAFESFRWFFLLAIPAGLLVTFLIRYARLVQLRVRFFRRDFTP